MRRRWERLRGLLFSQLWLLRGYMRAVFEYSRTDVP